MPKTTFQLGERLNFTINSHGMCATPNVMIVRNDEAHRQEIIVYDYRGASTYCPATVEAKAGQPHFVWIADQLQQTFSDEYLGGSGNSVVMSNAAITLKKAGNYTITASLLDWSDSASKEFTVVVGGEDRGIGATPPIRMNLTSLKAFTPIHELIGKVVPHMEFKKGQQVLFNATFANPSANMLGDIILTLGIRDMNENPSPDDISIITGDAMPNGTLSIENSWMPEKVGEYDVMIFSITQSDLKSTIPVSPVVAVPIRVVE